MLGTDIVVLGHLLTPRGRVGLDKIERSCSEIPEAQASPRDAHHQVRALADDQLKREGNMLL